LHGGVHRSGAGWWITAWAGAVTTVTPSLCRTIYPIRKLSSRHPRSVLTPFHTDLRLLSINTAPQRPWAVPQLTLPLQPPARQVRGDLLVVLTPFLLSPHCPSRLRLCNALLLIATVPLLLIKARDWVPLSRL